MTSREDILNRLRAAQRPAIPTPIWRSQRDFADLAARFTLALRAAQGEVHQAQDWPGALDILTDLLTEMDARQGVVNAEPPLERVAWAERWPALTWHIVGRTPGDLRAWNATADVGISAAQAALAETGTLIITSGPGRSRLATLTPPVHIVLLPLSALTPDLFTWTSTRSQTWPAHVTLVSGPSKSADIEQTLIVGMHGPKRLVVIMYAGNAG